jgi:hypothetical protein
MYTCIHCRRDLPRDAFGNHKGRRDDRSTVCRDCKNAKQRARRSTPEGRAEAAAAASAHYWRKKAGITQGPLAAA